MSQERYSKLVAEIQAMSAIAGTPTMSVLNEKLESILRGSSKTIPMGENNWELKAAHREGYVDCITDLVIWLNGRVHGHLDEKGVPRVGRTAPNTNPRYPSVNGGEQT